MGIIDDTLLALGQALDDEGRREVLWGFARMVLKGAMAKWKAKPKQAAKKQRRPRTNKGLYKRPGPSCGTPTSTMAAAASTPEKRQTQRDRILAFITAKGQYGATLDEVCSTLSIKSGSACPRLWELARAGLIHRNLDMRKTQSECDAFIWRA